MSDTRLTRIEDKIDRLTDKVASIDTTLSSQHMVLEEHVRRTNLLEEQIKPIEKHVNMVTGALKLIGLIATFAAIGEGIFTMLSYFRK